MRIRTPPVVLSMLVAATIGWMAATLPRSGSTAERPDHAAQSIAAEQQARVELERIQSSSGAHGLAAARATDSLVRALIDNGHAWTDEALRLARQAVDAKDASGPLPPRDIVASLLGLGEVLVSAADYDGAISTLRRAETLAERTSQRLLTALDERTAVLDTLGAALGHAGRFDEALEILRRSLNRKLSERAPLASVALTLESQAWVAQHAGRYEQSGAAIRGADRLRRRIGPSDAARVNTLMLLGQQLWFEGRLRDSKQASEDALELARRVLRPTHPTVAEATRYLAATLADLGEVSRARELREETLTLARREFGEESLRTADYMNSAALADLDAGDYTVARQRFTAALDAFQRRYGSSHNYVATVHLNLALVHARLGDYVRAQEENDTAVATWERTLGHGHPYVAIALSELAAVYNDQERPWAARPLLERALAIRERRLGVEHPDTARTLVDLASTRHRLGDTTEATQLAGRALGIWQRRDTPYAPEYASVLRLSGELRHDIGDDVTARRYYEQALTIFAHDFGRASPLYAEAEAGYGEVLASLGESRSAIAAAVHAEEISRAHLLLLLRALPERQALAYASSRPRGLPTLLSLASSEGAVPPALDAVIRSRALVLDEVASRRGPAGADSPPLREWRNAMQRVANLLARGTGPMSTEQYVQALAEAQRDREKAEQQLAESPDFATTRAHDAVGLAEIKAAIPRDGVVVSFLRSRQSGAADGRPRGAATYSAFVISATAAPRFVALGDAAAIDAQIQQWRAQMSPESHIGGRTPSDAAGLALRRAIWDPLVPHLGGARTIFLVPDASLALVPFAALPTAQGRYVVEEDIVIHYLTSERDLIRREQSPGRHRSLLAIGGAVFDTDAAVTSRRPVTSALRTDCGIDAVHFDPLPGTLREVEDVARVWSGASDGRIRTITGSAATEAEFKREAPHYQIVHLATHGFFVTTGCTRAETSDTRGVGRIAERAGADSNPLQLAGLAFSGANARNLTRIDDEDGVLMAEEVAGLDLSGVEWAVLSACDSGLGTVKAGEGVFGLRRAFQVAGVRTVIMSLWSVDDRATQSWMRNLYDARVTRGKSSAESVRDASLAVLRQRREAGLNPDPFYWAAFVGAGDWR